MRIRNLRIDLKIQAEDKRERNNLKKRLSFCRLKFKDLEAHLAYLRTNSKVPKRSFSNTNQSNFCLIQDDQTFSIIRKTQPNHPRVEKREPKPQASELRPSSKLKEQRQRLRKSKFIINPRLKS